MSLGDWKRLVHKFSGEAVRGRDKGGIHGDEQRNTSRASQRLQRPGGGGVDETTMELSQQGLDSLDARIDDRHCAEIEITPCEKKMSLSGHF